MIVPYLLLLDDFAAIAWRLDVHLVLAASLVG
jgi:hypothetical protein